VFTATVNNRASVTIANYAKDSLEGNVLRADDASYWLFLSLPSTQFNNETCSRVYNDSRRIEEVFYCHHFPHSAAKHTVVLFIVIEK
jgi:CRISPR/Cas system type I-B associated protein Csh2 (Cas7 group RAMP superfamily)